MCKKIILLGYMGSGKTTIGKELAQKLKLQFIDLDNYIEEKEQKTISEIFKIHREVYFRKIEHKYLSELLQQKTSVVLALGGGTPCFGTNMELIKKATNNSFYLHLPASVLIERLKNEAEKRPVISHLQTQEQWEEFINKHLFDRNPFYTQAQYIISVKNKSISEIVENISEKIEN